MDFTKTTHGRKFFEHDLPQLTNILDRIATSFEVISRLIIEELDNEIEQPDSAEKKVRTVDEDTGPPWSST